ncbi:MAG: PRD domain-containing protein [Erysipelotrichaceae bacterium]|nr:PRD domain-containing protein [Erysipelotrichaceae bacterium]
MKKHLIQLIRILKQSEAPITSSSLANALNVSPRSVKSYITEINDTLPDTITSSRKGYVIDKEKAEELLNESKSLIPQTKDERVSYIINRLIKQGVLNAYDLCDEMFVSYSTLKNDLVAVRRVLSETSLELINQNDTLVINGLEKNKRKLLSSLMYSESHNNFVNYEKMSEKFADIDVTFIKDTILKKFEEYHYFINDYSLENLILHATITIDRIRNGYSATIANKMAPFLKSHEYDLARSIVADLEKRFQIRFNEVEIGEFAMLILSRASNLDYEVVTVDNVRQYVGEDIYQLASDLIQDFSNFFYIDLSQPEFFVRFCLHIKNLLIRSDSGYFSKNPLTDSIKQNCPLIYDEAVVSARLIKERTGISLNDDEIAYIAFHLGGALELQNTLSNKLTTYIFCPGYYDMNTKLSDKLSERFSNVLVIAGVLTQEEELSKLNCDLLISTMRISSPPSIPTVYVSPFIKEQDLKNVFDSIEAIRAQKKKKEFRERLSYLIKEELFTLTDQKLNKEEVIHFMSKQLQDLGYVGDNFESEVIERDSISSTAFGTFAIPHAMKMHEIRTGINIMIAKEPIDWDGKKVELVMMLCFNINERYLFNELFEPISMILVDPDNLSKVLKTKNADEFIDTLADLLP